METLAIDSLHAYRARLEADPQEWPILDAMCRITISRFYRDKGVFRILETLVLPELAELAKREGRAVDCWSAGCASGEEVYTLKIVWDELIAPEAGVPLRILGTDVDDHVLTRARRACYGRGSLKEMPGELVARCFDVRDSELCVLDKYRRGVSFSSQDIRTAMPDGPFDLILCRNLVFTYFEIPLQRKLLAYIAARLRPRGCLVVGAHEKLSEGGERFVPLPECSQILKRA
jgi:chemotaxis protein methyltransferase CheR